MPRTPEIMLPYRTVTKYSEVEIVIQKSRFIGYCFAVAGEAEAQEYLARIKKKHWDASHNCYGYTLGADGSVARFSDDGEPGGTAGLPIMECIKNKEIKNVLIVVTRYFGGILLGAGGLIRAYTRATSEAIENANPVWMLPSREVSVILPYSRWGGMEVFLHQFGNILDLHFTHEVEAKILVAQDKLQALIKAVMERSEGRAAIELLGEHYGTYDTVK